MQASFKITDDSGFLALVNADRYSSFVQEDWDFHGLLDHFIVQMNEQNLVIWGTGIENLWKVDILDAPSGKPAFREFTQTIDVTDGRLYLTNYEDLTMAAQFSNERLPANHNADACISLPNGSYELTVRQMGDPSDLKLNMSDLSFEILVRPATAPARAGQIEGIAWFGFE